MDKIDNATIHVFILFALAILCYFLGRSDMGFTATVGAIVILGLKS